MNLVQTTFFWIGVCFSVVTSSAVLMMIWHFLVWRAGQSIHSEMTELVNSKELLRIVKDLATKAKAKHEEQAVEDHHE